MIKRYIILIISLIVIILVKGYPQLNEEKHTFEIDHNNVSKELKFIIIGDPQINLSTGDGIERLKQVVNFVNGSDVDFIVFMGDMTDDGKEKSNDLVKDILKNLKKPYYVVAGNHDIKDSPRIFEYYYGPMEHIENINGYQLIFVGINLEKNDKGNEKLNWSFDFSKVDKNVPTLVFIHGPTIDVKGCLYCIFQRDNIYYADSIRPFLDKFTNLIGVYSGHVHFDSNSFSNKTRYVTINGLINLKVMNMTFVRPSDNIGYSIIKDDKSYYEIIPYN